MATYHAYLALCQVAAMVTDAAAAAEDGAALSALRRVEGHLAAIALPGLKLETLESIFALIFLRTKDVTAGEPASQAPQPRASTRLHLDVGDLSDRFLALPRTTRRLLNLLKEATTGLDAVLKTADDEVRGHMLGAASRRRRPSVNGWMPSLLGLCWWQHATVAVVQARLEHLQVCVNEALWRFQIVAADTPLGPATQQVRPDRVE